MPSNPQFDELDGILLLNFRRIPLDNWANAFCKRAMDIVGSLLLILHAPNLVFRSSWSVLHAVSAPPFTRMERNLYI